LKLFFAGSIVLLWGCNTTFHYAEFITPSEVFIPSQIYQVGLINRGVNRENATAIFIDGVPREYVKGLPLQAVNITTDYFRKAVSNLKRYEIVPIEWDASGRDPKKFLEPELSAELIDSICEVHKLDGIISIDGAELTIRTNGDVNVVTAVDDAGMPVRVPEFNRQQEVSLTLVWRFYDGYHLKAIDDFQETYQRTFYNTAYAMPEDEEVRPEDMNLMDVCRLAAADYHDRVSPHWFQDHRVYYKSGSMELAEIAQRVEADNNWELAANRWIKLTESEEEKVKYFATFNMAVASEMLGRPRVAKEWLLRAQKLNDNMEVKNYMETLNKQILIYDVVDRQLGIEN
jgi:hypothetical protein